MLPQAQVSHQSPWRLRLRIPSQRGQMEYFNKVAQQLMQCPGVERVEANPLTASILVLPGIGTAELAKYAKTKRLFQFAAQDSLSPPVTEMLAANFRGLNQELRRLSGGVVDIGTLAFAALVTGAIIQWQKGHILGPASTLFWYAAGLLLMTRVGKAKDAN